LLEGLPGLAARKTLAIKTLLLPAHQRASARRRGLAKTFSRIQFTPDLLPADIIGTMIYNPSNDEFTVRKGPIFANFILADEINRAPAKVQSALLEAMQERQVTIGNETLPLEEPFLVLATHEPHRTGGHLSPARSAGGPLHAQGEDRLPNAKEEEREIIRRNLNDGLFGEVKQVVQPRGDHPARESVREGVHGREDRALHRRHRLLPPASPIRLQTGQPRAAHFNSAEAQRASINLALAAKA
jgi:MoxR-like ATPase